MLLFSLAALAAFLTFAHRRAEAIRLRVERRRVEVPRALPSSLPARLGRQRR